MNCRDFESNVHELVSRRMTDNARRLETLEHAGQCLWCALRLDEESKLSESLQVFARTMDGQRAPVRVEEALLQAFREANLPKADPRLVQVRKRLWRGFGWGLAFAATVATAWIVVLQGPRFHPRPSTSVAQAGNNPSGEAAGARHPVTQSSRATGHTAPAQPTKPKAPTPVRRLSPLRTPARPLGRVERAARSGSVGKVTTDFISLGTCDDSECMDEATLVRVTLPAEAVLAFGLPADDLSAAEGGVQAEVALASDGVPFAIRFLN